MIFDSNRSAQNLPPTWANGFILRNIRREVATPKAQSIFLYKRSSILRSALASSPCADPSGKILIFDNGSIISGIAYSISATRRGISVSASAYRNSPITALFSSRSAMRLILLFIVVYPLFTMFFCKISIHLKPHIQVHYNAPALPVSSGEHGRKPITKTL